MSTERPGEDLQLEPAIDRAWREASNEGPPPHVDEAILAAARSPRRSLGTWQPLAAVATVAGLAFLLVQLMPIDRDVPPPARIERTAPVESKSAPARDVASQESSALPQAAPTRDMEPPAASTHAPAASPVAAAPIEADARAETPTPEAPTLSGAVSNEVAADATGMAAAPAAPAASVEAAAERRESGLTGAFARRSPESWAGRVEARYRAGDLEAAAAELQAFRAAYPDADRYLTDELRAWAGQVE